MIHRTLSTIGLWVIVGLVIYLGSCYSLTEQAAFGVLALLVGAAQYEFYQICNKINHNRRTNFTGIIAGFVFLFVLFFFASERLRANPLITALAFLFALHLLNLLRNPQQTPPLVRHLPNFYGFLYVPFMLSPLVAIARMESGVLLNHSSVGLFYVIWVAVATKFTDVGGLLIGVPFGKHKIAPTISPAKSWEGVVGGLFFSALASALYAWVCLNVFHIPFMLPTKAAILALPLAIASVPSDLIESVFKRQAGVKDSGSTIPGIGGALDLIDSLILTAPLALVILSYGLEWAKSAW